MAVKPSVAILIGSHLPPNVESILLSLGEMLHQGFDLGVVINGANLKLPDHILEYYAVWDYARDVDQLPSIGFIKEGVISFYIIHKHTRSCHPDLLFHITKPQTYGFAIFLAGKLTDTPFIARSGGDILNKYKRASGWKKVIHLIRLTWTASLAFRFASSIITIGPALTKELTRRGFRPERIVTIPQPINKQKFYPPADKRASKLALNLPLDKTILLFVGRMEKLSDHNLMPAIIEKVLASDQTFVFCFVGDSTSYADRLKHTGKHAVRIIGQVPHRQIPNYYRAADLLLHLSVSEGSIPNTVLEALASELPICVNRFGDIETATNNVFDDANEIANFILSKDWPLDPLPAQYQWNKIKQQYIACFSNVLGGNKNDVA